MDIGAYTLAEFQLPSTLAETSQDLTPVPPDLWLSRIRRALCILLERSTLKEREHELKFRMDLSNALSLSSRVKIDPIVSRAGFLVWITQYTNLKNYETYYRSARVQSSNKFLTILNDFEVF